MEALAFIHPLKPSLSVAIAGYFQACGKHLHPSEDGEALRTGSSEVHMLGGPAIVSGVRSAGESHWFAVYTTCRHEKRIAQHLTQREIEHYLPLYSADRKWRDGSRVRLNLPLFPSYIFVRIERSERARILSVPGAVAFVGGTGGAPATVPDSAIEALRAGLREHRIEPHPILRVGQRARICSGAFVGMEGVVIRRKSGCRVVLTLEQIMQSIAVDVDENVLERISPSHAMNAIPFESGHSLRWREAS